MFEFICKLFVYQKEEKKIIKSYDYGTNNGDEDRYCSEHNGL